MMKASNVLAVVVMASFAVAGCVSHEKPLQMGGHAGAAQEEPAEESRAIVAHLVEVHNETVGQMRVSTGLRPQQRLDCN